MTEGRALFPDRIARVAGGGCVRGALYGEGHPVTVSPVYSAGASLEVTMGGGEM